MEDGSDLFNIDSIIALYNVLLNFIMRFRIPLPAKATRMDHPLTT